MNICNNNCLYCLEQSYRTKEYFIEKNFIINILKTSCIDEIITFYGGNPLLHPNLIELIKEAKNNGFKYISLLSNTYSLNKIILDEMKNIGLNSFGFYFNSFNKKNHELVNGKGITYELLIKNIFLLKESGLILKAIIHINNINIGTIARDILILSSKYGIKNFEFINYFPFDRPYENKDILDYSILENEKQISLLFKVIKNLNLKVKFVKFPKDFFGKFIEFYDFKEGILKQIGEEDIIRFSGKKTPFCFEEKRCISCFIRDDCKFYL
ncbi:MAG: radical SAM protein [Candidatus Gracilibacteria bacterium]